MIARGDRGHRQRYPTEAHADETGLLTALQMNAPIRKPLRTVVLATLCVVLFPLLMPYYFCRDWRTRLRRRKVSASFQCSNCDDVLGVASLKQADNEWLAYLRALKTKYPSVPQASMHARRWLYAVCKTCGARYTYRAADQSFVTIEDRHDIPSIEHEPIHGGG